MPLQIGENHGWDCLALKAGWPLHPVVNCLTAALPAFWAASCQLHAHGSKFLKSGVFMCGLIMSHARHLLASSNIAPERTIYFCKAHSQQKISRSVLDLLNVSPSVSQLGYHPFVGNAVHTIELFGPFWPARNEGNYDNTSQARQRTENQPEPWWHSNLKGPQIRIA